MTKDILNKHIDSSQATPQHHHAVLLVGYNPTNGYYKYKAMNDNNSSYYFRAQKDAIDWLEFADTLYKSETIAEQNTIPSNDLDQ